MHGLEDERSGQPTARRGRAPGTAPGAELAPHLVQVPGTDWALWRWTALRATGFPIEQLLSLGRPECAATADLMLTAEEDLEWAKEQLLVALRSDSERLPKELRRVLWRTRRRIFRNLKVEDLRGIHDATLADLEEFHDALEDLEDARARFEDAFETARGESNEAILRVARDDLFQEAILWQNRSAFHTGLRRLLKAADPGKSQRKIHRKHELVARYLQRYCAKNDTIGFFGPLGWARWTDDGEAVTVTTRPRLFCGRETGFEVWGLDELARVLEPELREWLPPRRLPFLRLKDNAAILPLKEPCRLSDAEVAVLAACDGRRTARQLAADLPGSESTPRDAVQVFELLERFRAAGWIAWSLEVPLGIDSERWLREQLEAVGDAEKRDAALAKLERLEAARRKVDAAAGDPRALDQAMGHLEAEFSRLTGAKSTRAAGRTYAARTLLFEDSRRDVDVTLGPDLLEALAPPLGLLLTGVRWLTYRTAEECRRSFRELYTQLAAQAGSPRVELADFWFQAQQLLFGSRERPIDRAIAEYQARWARVLAVEPDVRQVQRSCAKLRPRVLEAFETSESGWPSAYYHSPDLMIAADGVEAIREGRFLFVLGEVHPALNTVDAATFATHHPRPEELYEAFAHDVKVPRLVVEIPKGVPRATARTVLTFAGSQDYSLATSARADAAPGPRSLEVKDLLIEEIEGELIIRSHDGDLRFEAIDGFSAIISLMLAMEYKFLPSGPHNPRTTLDRLVINRESWRLAGTDPAFAWVKDRRERFLAARRWARGHGMPRFVFARISTEIKPVYVDFDSPIYVDILAKDIRRAAVKNPEDAVVSVSEMLPAPDQLGLPDALNRTYTSELRVVAVDLAT